ncbi:TIGR01777 family oxidoreductase [Priestia koreensis]|uniref:TIGR01777 family oxidoreductase n=1 Tax=Priestia koreensis TaxID=284581 RepID=UPI0020409F0B|nr:TIGR01777 family oxidoreductase [Priestia koreensis]MCM3006980.1 TIGR01777 family oxidoreductase [Priestia koreensis]
MKIVIAGGTGLVGSALTKHFLQQGHTVAILTRNANKPKHDPNLSYIEWMKTDSYPEHEVEGADAVINLAGVSLNSGRWTEERKKAILSSRLDTTTEIVRILGALNQKPSVYINASAVGYYGTSLTDTFTDYSASSGDDFLAQTVKAWEQAAMQAENIGIRTVLARFGIVLDRNKGALPTMVLPYKLFAGGTLGSGKQWVSWIHIQDLVHILAFAIEHEDIEGPLNVTTPHPIRMKEMGKAISQAIHRPHWLPAPSFALKIVLGDMSLMVLEGQKVIPQKLGEHHYNFAYNNIDEALKDLL